MMSPVLECVRPVSPVMTLHELSSVSGQILAPDLSVLYERQLTLRSFHRRSPSSPWVRFDVSRPVSDEIDKSAVS